MVKQVHLLEYMQATNRLGMATHLLLLHLMSVQRQ